ncbi:hypothetical protein GEMRC1_006430 [Eukaryota sp. GEM-RC1]
MSEPLLYPFGYNKPSSSNKACWKCLLIIIIIAWPLIGAYHYIDLGLRFPEMSYMVDVTSSDTKINVGTYAVDPLQERFYASTGFLTFKTELWCTKDTAFTKVLGKCFGVSFNCRTLIESLMPKIPHKAKKTGKTKVVDAIVGSRTCNYYRHKTESWCAVNSSIFEYCIDESCVSFANRRSIWFKRPFKCVPDA